MATQQYSAQNSIRVTRLQNGETFYISFDLGNNGNPLYQGVDDKSGTVVPDWTDPTKQPIIIPKVVTARGNQADLSFHAWKYNGIQLNFNGAETDGWKADSTGKFMMETATGALRIVANLASLTNVANDTLTYTCQATVSGKEYNLEKSVDILIQTVGTNAYVGFVDAETTILDASTLTVQLIAKLMFGGAWTTDFYVKWYKDDTEWTAKAGQKQISVGRSDVDGTQLFIAEFYKDSSSTTPLYRAGIRIIDSLDDYIVNFSITSANKDVGPGSDVTYKAYVENVRTKSQQTLKNAAWSLRLMKEEDLTEIRRVSTDTITVTTADTDDPTTGEGRDVLLHAEVDFDI